MPEPTPLIRQAKQRHDPHLPLVKMLEGMLVDAREGRLQGCLAACVYSGDWELGEMTSIGVAMAPYTRYAAAYAMAELNVYFQQDVANKL